MKTESFVYRLGVASFLAQFAIVIYNFTLVFFLREIGFSSVRIGVASSIYPLMYFIFCLVFPYVAKGIGAKERILLSLFGMGCAGLLLVMTTNAFCIYSILVLYGISMALLWTNVETWICQGAFGQALTKRLSVFNFSWSLGSGLATTVAGYFVEKTSTRISILFGVFVFLLALAIVLTTKEKKASVSVHVQEANSDEPVSPMRYLAWTGVFLVYTGYSLVITVFPQYALDCLGFTESLTGNLLLARGLAVFASFFLLARMHFWEKRHGLILASQLAFAALTVVMVYIRIVPAFVALFIAYGMFFALSYQLSIYHSAQGEKGRHLRMTIHEALLTAGTMGGSLAGGFIYQFFSFRTLVFVIAGICIASVLVEFIVSRKQESKLLHHC